VEELEYSKIKAPAAQIWDYPSDIYSGLLNSCNSCNSCNSLNLNSSPSVPQTARHRCQQRLDRLDRLIPHIGDPETFSFYLPVAAIDLETEFIPQPFCKLRDIDLPIVADAR
jgi:hypothetical protein